MKRFWSIIKWSLIVWGILCAFATLGIIGFIKYKLGPGNRPSSNPAAHEDLRFILNHGNIENSRIVKVLHSHRSARSFSGDHLDAHALEISPVNIEELKKERFGRTWSRCDQAEGVTKDAIDFVAKWLYRNEIQWFLSEKEIRSDEIYVCPVSIYFGGLRPIAAQLIFFRPKDNMIFYFSCKS